MSPIRVFIVDDSVVIRRLLTDAISADPMCEVAGTASNGAIALEKLDRDLPDVVTLDIEMPVMDGLETLRELRKRHPRLPVVMLSTLTERGARATLDALASGANDFVAKPANVGSVTEGIAAIQNELLPRLKALTGTRSTASGATARSQASGGSTRPAGGPASAVRGSSAVPSPAARSAVGQSTPAAIAPRTRFGVAPRPSVIVIGVSTGGPNALTEVWRSLPTELRVPIVIVQHMPPVFTELLAKRLDDVGTIPVVQAIDGAELQAGRAYLAPGDHHLVIEGHEPALRLRLNQDPPENSCRPSVDPLFRSAVNVYGANVLGLILTGMGSDGLSGARAIRSAGGVILAQDEATSVVWGMPGAVVRAGLADVVVPLDAVASELVARCSKSSPSDLRRLANR